MTGHQRGWFFDVIVGGSIGLVLGAIAAVNAIIFLGTDAGYEATPSDLLRERPLVAALAIALQLTGPVVGVVLARRFRADRQRR